MIRTSLYTRVLIVVVALFAGAAALSGLLSALVLSETLEKQYRSKGEAIATTIAGASVEEILLGHDAGSLQSLVDQYAETEGVSYILVRSREGEILAHTFVPEVPPVLRAALEEGRETVAHRLHVDAADYLDITAPILDGEIGHVHVGMAQATINATFWRAARRQALTLMWIGLMAAMGAYLLVGRITRPLRLLARYVRSVAAEESLFLPARPRTDDLAPIAARSDEVGQLAGAMVHMLTTLMAREQQLRVAEESIRHSEQHFRSLIENVTDVVVLLDNDGKAKYLSPSLARLLEFEADEWLGRNVALLIHEDDRPAFEEARNHCAAGANGVSAEVRMVRADGALRLMDTSMTNLLDAPTGSRIVATFRDITERERTLELKQAKEAAEEASRLKSQFLANISHELFTPMNHVLLLTDLTLATTLTPEQRDNLQMLAESGQGLLGLLRNLLDFASLETGRLQLEVKPFCPRHLVAESMALLEARAEHKGLQLRAIVGESLPESLLGDADRLRQVILELAGNAIKFTKRGDVTVRVGWQDAEGETPASLCLEIADTGIGIEEAKQRQIFDPFVQADGSLTRAYEGVGMGLAIVRSLLELMGGTLALDSRPGEGSTFSVRIALPLAAGKHHKADPRVGNGENI